MIRQKMYQLVFERYSSDRVGSECAQSQEIRPPVSCVSRNVWNRFTQRFLLLQILIVRVLLVLRFNFSLFLIVNLTRTFH